MPKGTRLKGLRITENSGVDHGANLSDGWIVMKEKGDDADAKLEALIEGLEGADDFDTLLRKALPDMPPAVQPHAQALIDALSGDKEEAMTTKSAEDQLAEAQAETAAALTKAAEAEARAVAAEEQLTKAAPLTSEQLEEVEIAKAMESLPAAVRKRLEDDHARVTKAEQVAKAERDARLSREYLEIAKSHDGLGAKPEELGTVLRAIDERLDEPTAKELRRILKAASEQAASSETFKELGGVGVVTGGAMAELEAKAAALAASDPSLSAPVALEKAMDLNPSLVAKHYAESGIRGGN